MVASAYDFWLLDLDGTLIDVEQSYIHDIIENVGSQLGVMFTDREAEFLWYGVGDARKRLLDDANIDREEFWSVFHEVEEPETRAAATHLYDDAEDVIPAIDKPVGVVTHCQEYLTEPVLAELDIADWFDTVVCCTDETGWKPDPGPIELAMDDLGVGYNGHEGVLAGDDAQDIGAAWNAGLSAIHVERQDPAQIGRCVLGDHRVTSLSEL